MSVRRNRPREIKRTVVVSLAFSAVLGISILISIVFHFTTMSLARTDTIPQMGEIRFPPTKDGSCRTIKFDNHTGQPMQGETTDCDAGPTVRLGPFESIRKSFNGQ